MSISSIPNKVIQTLWVVAGGRCEFDGCNKPLWYDLQTKRNCNAAYVAHIIADKPAGPRGCPILSRKKCKDLDNLMLLCDTHHTMIDRTENIETYSVEVLTFMKKTHEDRIEFLTSLKNKCHTHIVFYTPNVGNNVYRINPEDAIDTVLPEFYPAEKYPIELSCLNSVFQDTEDKYWEFERDQLTRNYQNNIKRGIQDGTIKHLSIFAIAPQPLLIELGRLISDIQPVEIYQKHREPDTWKWIKGNDFTNFIIHQPDYIHKRIALNLSLSGTIDNSRIISILGNDISIWTLSIDNPQNDFVKDRTHVQQFREKMRFLFNRIKEMHGHKNEIHLFPACPISLAIEIGRVWMPKADLPLILYDQNKKNNSFVKTFEIS
jgi:hypothetical protein